MNNSIFKNIIFVIGLLFFQIMILNQLNISNKLLPFIYPVVILSLPRNINKSLLLGIGFGLGLILDVFMNTGGANAVATLTIAFVRPIILSSLAPSDMGSETIKPSIQNLGFKSYFVYAFLLLAIHHIIFFVLEVFSFANFFWLFARIIISLLFSLLLTILFQYIFQTKSK